ncbi:hypothetical protein CASFOL_027827 [Castilleja foliolosa]|uniref:F-box domain-containing protein n=1 Tax=Castilleja foliolosa TaxID=1961234 RepID=A0ABD3CIJ0_9LAMI
MPPKKLENSQATNSAAALAACEDLVLCVLARLPVKSIFRFKSVCKSWNHLFSTQEFVRMQVKLSTESKNQSLLVHVVDKNGSNTFSVFNIESNEKILAQQLDYTLIDIVGCCRGLVCIRGGQGGFVLWNPAMNLSKTVLPSKDRRYFRSPSPGFGYDAEGDDFKVVRIVCLKDKRKFEMFVSYVEVYSVNSDSWTTIDPGFQFSKVPNRSDATVNGNPYWLVRVDKNDVLICFNMSKLVFKIVPLSTLDYNNEKMDVEFADLKGSFGAFVFTWRHLFVNVWVFDDVEQVWTKSHSVKMNPVLQCLNYLRLLGMRQKGQLFVNSETKCVEGLFNDGHEFEIYDYTASLAYIQGMEKVTLKEWRM